MATTSSTPTMVSDDEVVPATIPMSYHEYLAWYDKEAGRRGEWVDGEVIVFVAPKTIHQLIARFLTVVLSMYVEERGLGAIVPTPEMRLGGGRSYREPDLLFVAEENLGRLDADGLQGPADLVVEIVSDDSVRRDRQEKHAEYAAAGVPEYWVIDPRPLSRRFDAYSLSRSGQYEEMTPDDRGRVRSIVIPGLWLDPTWLWSEPIQTAPAALKLIAGD